MDAITTDHIRTLYQKYEKDLRAVRDAQRQFLRDRGKSMKAQLDDYEAEITYLLLRDLRPDVVVEIGTFYGWSTMWILSALRDNEAGHLHSFDIVDNVVRNVPAELSEGRWTFTKGDVREHLGKVPADVDYLFIDATTAPGSPTGTSTTSSRPFPRTRRPASTTSSTAAPQALQRGLGHRQVAGRERHRLLHGVHRQGARGVRELAEFKAGWGSTSRCATATTTR